MIIRREEKPDFDTIEQVVLRAFAKMEMSDHKEQVLIRKLRDSNAYIPELALVAEYEGEIVGHIFFSPIEIVYGASIYPSIALAPVSVLPEFQRRGIGSALIVKSHEVALELGHTSIILLGHEDYYPRFGYKMAKTYGISFPFPVPDKNAMALELIPDALEGIQGEVVYSSAFYD